MVVLQEIVTWWTKRSRAAPGAALRRAVPSVRILPVGTVAPRSSSVLHHEVVYREWTGFDTPEESVEAVTIASGEPLVFGCLRLLSGSDVVEVVYAYDMNCGGAPERTSLPRQVLRLKRGEWGRVIYNGRFTHPHSGEWLYKEVVANVANTDPSADEAFPGEPVKVFRDLANLR